MDKPKKQVGKQRTCASGRLMISAKQEDIVRHGELESQDKDEDLDAPRAAIDAVSGKAHEIIMCWPSDDGKGLDEGVQIAVGIAHDMDAAGGRGGNIDDVVLACEDILCGDEQLGDGGLGQGEERKQIRGAVRRGQQAGREGLHEAQVDGAQARPAQRGALLQGLALRAGVVVGR